MEFWRKAFDSCMLVLTSGAVSKDVWIYLESLDQEVLASRRPDERLGINHCVHEKRITEGDQTKEKVSLDQLLKRKQWCPERGIIAISAPEDGYAKDYFAERLMTLAYDWLKDQSGSIRNFWCLRKKVKEWYLPIFVMEEVLEGYHDDAEMTSVCTDKMAAVCADKMAYVCTDSIKLWLENHTNIRWDKRQCGGFRRFMKYMLQKEQVLLLLPRGCLEDVPRSIQKLIVWVSSREKKEHGNLAIYVVDRNKEFCSLQYMYPVELGELTNDEIMAHIKFVVKNNSERVGFFERQLEKDASLLKKELQIPERLLLLSKLLGESGIEDKHFSMDKLKVMKSTMQFYEFIICKSIAICVKEVCGGDIDNKASRVVYETLRDVAWRGIDEGKEEGLLNRVNDDFRKNLKTPWIGRLGGTFEIWTKLAQHKDFLIDSDYNFYFVGCKHYLIAENLFSLLKKDLENIKIALSNPVFLEKSNRQIYLFLIDIIKDRVKNNVRRNQYFDIIWNSVTDDKISGENNRVQVLADIMNRYGIIGDMTYSSKFGDFILKELSKQYYDSNIFDTLHSISIQYEELNINHYLMIRYSELRNSKNFDAVDNQKRRLVYYFGKEKCGIPEAAIEDLVDAEVHIHVKYHIMLAVIENYDPVVESLLEKHKQKIKKCVKGWEEDCILYSDYQILFAKRNNVERGAGSEENELQERLFQELEKGEYWRRAHAAGALGRQGLLKSVDELLDRLADEISRIPEEENSLKAVSYMVEAICEIFYWQNKDIKEKEESDSKYQRYHSELEASIKKFMELITFDGRCGEKSAQDVRMRYFVVFATVSEGIIYLVESVENKMPEEIGRHIKDGIKDLGGKYNAITKALEIISVMLREETDNAEQKCRMVDDFYKKLSVICTPGDDKKIGKEQKIGDVSIQGAYTVNNSGSVENQTNIEAQNVLQFNISLQDTVKAMDLEKDTDSSSNGMI